MTTAGRRAQARVAGSNQVQLAVSRRVAIALPGGRNNSSPWLGYARRGPPPPTRPDCGTRQAVPQTSGLGHRGGFGRGHEHSTLVNSASAGRAQRSLSPDWCTMSRWSAPADPCGPHGLRVRSHCRTTFPPMSAYAACVQSGPGRLGRGLSDVPSTPSGSSSCL